MWLDDVRPAPKDWHWVKTVEEAQEFLDMNDVTECSLDHDLGAKPSDGLYAKGSSPNGSGEDLAKWMVANRRMPEKITIHSWNPTGAKRMAMIFLDGGHSGVLYHPYEVPDPLAKLYEV